MATRREPEKWAKGATPRLYQVSSATAPVEADHRRAQAHPARPHLRRGYRPPGGGGHQALPAAQGAGRRKPGDASASSSACSASVPCPTWAATSSAATRSSDRISTPAQQSSFLDAEEQYRINAFDWQTGISAGICFSPAGSTSSSAIRRMSGKKV